VKKIFLFTLFLFSFLHANKVLYLSYESIPERVIKGAVFSVTVKTISTVQNYQSIEYSFHNQSGIRVLNTIPYREIKGKFFLDTFKFIAISRYAKFPDIEAKLIADAEYETTQLNAKKLNIISLNPQKDFSNIIASSFELLDYKTTSYDNKSNIVVFSAQAQNTSLDDINFNNVLKQGIESLTENNVIDPRITYYVVIDKKIEQFKFTYFNTQSNKFEKILIPITVDDDSVTTQTDLKPKDQSKEQLKVNIAIALAVIIFILALWRKKYIYVIFIFIPLGYIAFMSTPPTEVCIKKGTNIHLLPVDNGTIFEMTQKQYLLMKEGEATNYTKVKLHNEKIGWVKNEDLCSY